MDKYIANELALLLENQIESAENDGDFDEAKHIFFSKIQGMLDECSFANDDKSTKFLTSVIEWAESWTFSHEDWKTFIYKLFEWIPSPDVCYSNDVINNFGERDESGEIYFKGDKLG